VALTIPGPVFPFPAKFKFSNIDNFLLEQYILLKKKMWALVLPFTGDGHWKLCSSISFWEPQHKLESLLVASFTMMLEPLSPRELEPWADGCQEGTCSEPPKARGAAGWSSWFWLG